MEGKREETSKLAGDSGSRRSTFMVRQLIAAIIAGEQGGSGASRDSGQSPWSHFGENGEDPSHT